MRADHDAQVTRRTIGALLVADDQATANPVTEHGRGRCRHLARRLPKGHDVDVEVPTVTGPQ
jgi:hypothetical protein